MTLGKPPDRQTAGTENTHPRPSAHDSNFRSIDFAKPIGLWVVRSRPIVSDLKQLVEFLQQVRYEMGPLITEYLLWDSHP